MMGTDKILLLIIGILFLAAGIYLLVRQIRNRKHNTASAMAAVVGYHEEFHHDSSDGGSYVYYPVVRYCISGRWHEGKGGTGSNKKKYDVGEQVKILYDPENPENFSFAGDRTGLFMAVAAMMIGTGIILLAIFSK